MPPSEPATKKAQLWLGVAVGGVGAILAALFIGKGIFTPENVTPIAPVVQSPDDKCSVFFETSVKEEVEKKAKADGKLVEFINRTVESAQKTTIQRSTQGDAFSQRCGMACTMMFNAVDPESRSKFEKELLECMKSSRESLREQNKAPKADAAIEKPVPNHVHQSGSTPACPSNARSKSFVTRVRDAMGRCLSDEERSKPIWSVQLRFTRGSAPAIDKIDDAHKAGCTAGLEQALKDQQAPELADCLLAVGPER
jgi:hypothetical protein